MRVEVFNSDRISVFDLVSLKPKVCPIYLGRYFLGHNQDLFLKQTSIIKVPFTVAESESEKDQRTSKKDQRQNDKHQRKFSLSLLLSLDVNGLLYFKCFKKKFLFYLFGKFGNLVLHNIKLIN